MTKYQKTVKRMSPMSKLFVTKYPKRKNFTRHDLWHGGNLISFMGYVSKRTSNITTEKLLFNRTIYTKYARILFCNIETFFLGTPMERYKYIQLDLNLIPE